MSPNQANVTVFQRKDLVPLLSLTAFDHENPYYPGVSDRRLLSDIFCLSCLMSNPCKWDRATPSVPPVGVDYTTQNRENPGNSENPKF